MFENRFRLQITTTNEEDLTTYIKRFSVSTLQHASFLVDSHCSFLQKLKIFFQNGSELSEFIVFIN